MTPDERLVTELELALLDPAVRSSPERLDELLHADFSEFGASGRRWDRQAIIERMLAEPPTGERVVTSEVVATRLANDLIQVTYVSTSTTRRALRSSLWRRTGDHWQIYFHQGTPIPS